MSEDDKEFLIFILVSAAFSALILFIGFSSADSMVESIYESLPYLDCKNHD
ncbi:MAG: hypothetical protein Tp118SUR00d2C21406351_32 [Prokaryotic dsDNA virus sp.]|nr:MAG: hypothetical protein Tp118SUR00d2C21406351_32 [Prokaryotic dsDNA virus sp.]|tara:strand:+ start:322 stop:474 length:153 start_codon:yes stop_codon:yes gene_type:complete